MSALLVVIAAAAPGFSAVSRVSPTPAFSAITMKGGGGEPNVSISPSGRTVIVAGLSATPAAFWRSTDYGRKFARITPTFTRTGGGDWDMRFLDERTIVAVDLSIGEDGIIVHRSENAGTSWTSTTIAAEVYDRPWIEHFGRNIVYVVAKGWDGIPYLYTSTDGGKSFGTLPVPILVYGTGAVPAVAGGKSPTVIEAIFGSLSAYVDHLTVDPKTGDVYVLYGLGGENSIGPDQPIGSANRVYVARLQNGQMVSNPVYMGKPDDSFISGFNWMTVDAHGTVYALLNGSRNGHHSAYLSYSRDKGKTWSSLVDLGSKGAANVYGSIAAGTPGTLSLVYLRGTKENPSEDQAWYVEMARVTGANTSRPAVYRTRPVRKPVHNDDICFDGILCGTPGFGDNRDLLDFIWNAIAPDGTAYAVVASDGAATGDSAGNVSVLLLRQTGGAKHGRGAPS
jgi:hypothetical protein